MKVLQLKLQQHLNLLKIKKMIKFRLLKYKMKYDVLT